MNIKDELGCFVSIVGVLFVMPAWYFLLFGILSRIDASTAMWTVYWVYIPLGFSVAVGERLLKQMRD